MKKNALLSFTIMISALLLGQPVFAKTYTVLTGEWAPYVSEKLPNGGPTAQIVSEALAAAGHEVEFNYTTWKRTEAMTQKGKALATFPWTPTEKFEETCYVSSPLATQKMVFFYMKENHPDWDYNGLEDLKNYAVGGSQGYSYVAIFKKAGIEAEYAPSVENSLKKLYHGRIDMVPESFLVGWQTIKQTFPGEEDKFAASETPLFTKELHVMSSKEHPQGKEFHDAFEKGLQVLKDNGRYEAILDEYGLSQ